MSSPTTPSGKRLLDDLTPDPDKPILKLNGRSLGDLRVRILAIEAEASAPPETPRSPESQANHRESLSRPFADVAPPDAPPALLRALEALTARAADGTSGDGWRAGVGYAVRTIRAALSADPDAAKRRT